MTENNKSTETFERARPKLLGLAYRLLGSFADAEDVVQEVYLNWMASNKAEIKNPVGWMMTVCSRRAIDMLRSARVARTDYVGPWLPEPIETKISAESQQAPTPEQLLVTSETVTTAFLMVLERLNSKERAAFLLHDIFGMSFKEVAATIGMTEPACRKLASRARSNIQAARNIQQPNKAHQNKLVDAFLNAVETGVTDTLEQYLASDITMLTDGGGKVAASKVPLHQIRDITLFIRKVLHRAWPAFDIKRAEINGTSGLIVRDKDTIVAAASFAYDTDGQIADIYIMRNPDKLARLAATTP